MVTLLDCINRVPEITDRIIANRNENFATFFSVLEGHLDTMDQIVLVGSGTSNTAAVTARGFIEKVTQIQTICVLPNEFLNNSGVYRSRALYIFTSQSGTSTLTQQAVFKMRQMGYWTVGVTENKDTPLASQVHVHVDMGCGKEEYGMRTIGYCASILTLMLLGLEIGHTLGRITEGEYAELLDHARLISKNHRLISDASMAWFDRNRQQLMNSTSFTIYGGGSLWGVALEGALKILEISKRKMAVGYEADDGMHGPTMGFTPDNCVIALNDGGLDSEKGVQLAKWAKEIMHNGFVFGKDTLDDSDLAFDPISQEFISIEFAPTVEVLAYRLAVDAGIDLLDKSIHKERDYFSTHQSLSK